jgi:hypothetical protein
MRVVVDTNTLASGALAFTGSPASTILDAWREDLFTLVVSDDIVTELTPWPASSTTLGYCSCPALPCPVWARTALPHWLFAGMWVGDSDECCERRR